MNMKKENRSIQIRNLSAFWIPPVTVREAIHGTTYVVTGSFDGDVPFTGKLERIIARRLAEEIAAETYIPEIPVKDSKNGGQPGDRIEEL